MAVAIRVTQQTSTNASRGKRREIFGEVVERSRCLGPEIDTTCAEIYGGHLQHVVRLQVAAFADSIAEVKMVLLRVSMRPSKAPASRRRPARSSG